MTTSLVYSAAARGVRLTRVESTVEGDIDVRGALGLDDSFRNGFERIRMSFEVSGDATPEKLREVVGGGAALRRIRLDQRRRPDPGRRHRRLTPTRRVAAGPLRPAATRMKGTT